jgi:hypothetical protein
MITRRLLSAVALVLGIVVPGTALASFSFEPPHPVRGQPVSLRVTGADGAPLAGVAVTATYYPNSAIAREVPLGTTDASGRLVFEPHHAGLMRLRADEVDAFTTSVRFDGVPLPGVIVFIVAATLLFGGVAFGSRKILQGDYVDPTT